MALEGNATFKRVGIPGLISIDFDGVRLRSLPRFCFSLEKVFHWLSKHLEFRQKYSAARHMFNSLMSVFGYPDVTLSLVFDI